MKGRPKAYAPDKCVQTMRMFEEGYVHYLNIVFGRKKVYIDLLAPIIHKNDGGSDPDEDKVLIKRVGKGFEEKDFEVDFSKLRGIFALANEKETRALDRQDHLYLIITNTGFDLVDEGSIATISYEETIEKLQEKMDRVLSLKEPDYTAAAYYRDLIAKKKKRQK